MAPFRHPVPLPRPVAPMPWRGRMATAMAGPAPAPPHPTPEALALLPPPAAPPPRPPQARPRDRPGLRPLTLSNTPHRDGRIRSRPLPPPSPYPAVTRLVGAGPSSISFADIDGHDGIDIVVSGQVSGDLTILFNDPDHLFLNQSRY